ncbi:Uma2 family endonuclease [Nocardia huaxiensis]|uniref:Uma2 family endonuclease n=1 Tax=Nocardia huaxiensis TaxID=2755382 RepID=A0A7D6V9Q8_9NOCA|nr:Uma2 family endonuclease [Nocardia huaxiensis]QLY27697.1 Uma2 family endonuclease [Nocardia huaxiensis]UFS98914.1 Uma2 family endonuclease [Nocardia huaxiensis]
MTTQLDLPMTGVRTRAEFEALPQVPRGWAWELRAGRLELTLMPVTFWYSRIVFSVLEFWRRNGYEIAGDQYVADSGFARGDTGHHNFVADGVVFQPGHRPDKHSTTHDPAHLLAVVEAVWQDGQVREAIDKLRVYAMLGIPHYWIVRGDTAADDLDGFISMYELIGSEYRLTGSRLVSQLSLA